jgi:hypothetical protein
VDPWDLLASRIKAELPEVNITTGPAPTVEPDAIVIRADEPWMSHSDGAFRLRPEKYVALGAARVGDPASSFHSLYRMALGVAEAASDEGWAWDTVSGITLDESTGIPLLVIAVHVTYQAPTGGG